MRCSFAPSATPAVDRPRIPATLARVKRRSILRARRPGRWRRRVRLVLLCLGLVWVATSIWHVVKPLPAGISVATPPRPVENPRFLADYTFVDAAGERQVEQRIFQRLFGHIKRAERLVVLDMFLFNHFAGDPEGDDMRALSRELTDALVARKREAPDLEAILITDPINTFYGSFELGQLERLRQAGVQVVITDLKRLRDSNPAWSGLWRLCCGWAGNDPGSGWLPNPVADQPATLRGLLALPNFKANHRKTLIADTPTGWVGLVTSGNPHGASSAHSNIAIEFEGPAALDLLATERAVAAFSAPELAWPEIKAAAEPGSEAEARIQILTEAEIRDAVLAALDRTRAGDRIDLAMFYLSHRPITKALKAARNRGVQVRALLDPNRDAFGRTKNGIPNRPVARELVEAGIDVRWCDTHGEQCHDKLILIRTGDAQAELIAGSANFTRRNLDDYNLETNARIVAAADAEIILEAAAYFNRRWTNAKGRGYSVAYPEFADGGFFKYWVYRLAEASGFSTF